MSQFGLIGYPLEHSFSQNYFTNKFEKEGWQNYEYQTFPLPQIEDFPDLVKQHPELVGLNVTIPHKQSIRSYLDVLSAETETIGAVNTIRIDPDQLKGYNTDVHGFTVTLRPLLPNSPVKGLILGTGGAAQAVRYGLSQLNIEYQLVSRTPRDNCITYKQVTKDLLQNHKIIVNTTPLGMAPNTDQCPDIPYEALTNEHILYDLVYNPEHTKFLQKGEEQGATIKNGLDMLYQQAEKSWEIWTRSPRFE